MCGARDGQGTSWLRRWRGYLGACANSAAASAAHIRHLHFTLSHDRFLRFVRSRLRTECPGHHQLGLRSTHLFALRSSWEEKTVDSALLASEAGPSFRCLQRRIRIHALFGNVSIVFGLYSLFSLSLHASVSTAFQSSSLRRSCRQTFALLAMCQIRHHLPYPPPPSHQFTLVPCFVPSTVAAERPSRPSSLALQSQPPVFAESLSPWTTVSHPCNPCVEHPHNATPDPS